MNKAVLKKNIWWSSMPVRLKLNSQVYVNLTRYHWNRIIVELSEKYIDLLYLKCICHKSDKRYTPWKIVCGFFFFFDLFSLYDCMLVSVVLEHLTPIRTSPMVIEMPVLYSEVPRSLYVTSAWEALIWLYTWRWASGSKYALTKM